jgi:hypothetical protein
VLGVVKTPGLTLYFQALSGFTQNTTRAAVAPPFGSPAKLSYPRSVRHIDEVAVARDQCGRLREKLAQRHSQFPLLVVAAGLSRQVLRAASSLP